ncbi:hypothetical protein HYC85_010278 [Camellia sinensis]|uniref:Uncharacterized protein n=1 Tax=Camellia sinensis TaxID=4442 RepID=A0A7J7HK23_CAMSI|nr:hypothetical protein HYC85_010278 [Camellia sinensis]
MKERDVPPASEWRKSPYFGRKDPFWRVATSTTSLLSPKGAPLCLTEDTNSGTYENRTHSLSNLEEHLEIYI